jgi:hypothetical protein
LISTLVVVQMVHSHSMIQPYAPVSFPEYQCPMRLAHAIKIPNSPSLSLPNPSHSHLILLLLLILNQLNIILRHLLVLVHQKLLYILAQIALHRDLLAAAGNLGDAAARRKLLAKVLGHLLDVQAKRLEALYGGDVFALVAFYAFDEDLGGGEFFGAARFGRGGFGGLLLRVFFGAFLGVEGEGGHVVFYGFCEGVSKGFWILRLPSMSRVRDMVRAFRVQLAVHVWVFVLKPLLAFLGGAAEFAVLSYWSAMRAVSTRLGVVPTSGGRLHTA